MSKKPFCPNDECNSAHIAKKTNKPEGKEDGYAWRCRRCKTNFNEPNYREPKVDTNSAGNRGLSKLLADMDPDEL